MAYQVIARKFRPQSFASFVGQEHVTRTLKNALAGERFPHALLLTGPRGTGKTTTARIIAKTLLCQDRQGFDPCGQCRSCQDIQEGKHLDVIEIDGASNNGVDHIRELRETIGYMPSSGSHKIYIIDEVHMLSTSAFNALLKTLEEPPEHVIFIFATTEVQKIPATILSRCQRFDFRNHSLSDIKNHLQNICTAENIQFEEASLWTIARQAKGSIRDSLTLLDQLISFSEGKLSLKAVMAVLGLTDRHLLMSALKAIATQDESLMLSIMARFRDSGYDAQLFAEEFLEVLRNCLLVQLKAHEQSPLDVSEAELDDLKAIAPKLQVAETHLLFDVCLSGIQRLNFTNQPSLALEMLMLKLLHLPRLSQELSGEEKTASTRPVPQKSPVVASTAPRASELPTTEPEAKASLAVPLPSDDRPVGKTWEEFVDAVKQVNGFLGALLEHTSIYEQNETLIKLGLPNKMAFLFDKLSEPKNIERTKNFLESFWSDSRELEIVVLEKDHIHENLSPKAMSERARQQQEQRDSENIESHPLVKAAKAVFKDSITEVGISKVTPRPQQENEL